MGFRQAIYRGEVARDRAERSPVERILEESNGHADVVTAQEPAAVEDFDAAGTHLDEAWTAAFRSFGTRITGVVDPPGAGSQHLRDAAQARVEDRPNAADRSLDRARAALRENETVVEEIRAIQPILD